MEELIMNKNLLDLNLCIVKVLKHSYVYLNVLRNPEPNVALQTYRLCFKADNLYGVNGELWDGKPNEYITEETIEAARSDYKISKDEYDYFYSLSPEERIDAIGEMLGKLIDFGDVY